MTSTLRWTWHAAQRAGQMQVTAEEVEAAVDEPDLAYPNASGHPAGTTFVNGRLAVPVATDGSILTVLWHGKEGR